MNIWWKHHFRYTTLPPPLSNKLHNTLQLMSKAQFFECQVVLTRGYNFKLGFFFVVYKCAFSEKLLSLFFLGYPIIKLLAKRIKLNLLFKLSYLSSNFTLTLGCLDPASNNPAQVSIVYPWQLAIELSAHQKLRRADSHVILWGVVR